VNIPAQPVNVQPVNQPAPNAFAGVPQNPPQNAGPANIGGPFGLNPAMVEDRINDLIAITGADREQAILALRASFFDVNTAANYVFEVVLHNERESQPTWPTT
jgi:hypothetical protein